jgi:hypothetical protein
MGKLLQAIARLDERPARDERAGPDGEVEEIEQHGGPVVSGRRARYEPDTTTVATAASGSHKAEVRTS